MLIRMIYASRSAGVLGPADVKDIVRSSVRNNAPLGVTGALILSNGIFLQCLEGDHLAVNALYHRILLDPRHREPAILAFSEVDARLYGAWNMGLVPTTDANRRVFLKYSPQAEFDPYGMRPQALEALFAELVAEARVITALGA
ncbi:BLUF domain-containing protein [Pelomonas sp. UHG3]|uniref:BLUF domain-containing protein n=1 Tax=Roseateles hydrophilus TaxID=2975054 RepID=A0ACC6CB54_9BURK|nr:BLUF domain-containing protein [Pelomonas sp. UHG3]MCY4745671.1 BLUF domain-containing protein [Pelomonas sp. UHG3]